MSFWDSPEQTYRIIAVFAGAGIFLITLKHLAAWRHYAPGGIYPWRLCDERPERWYELLASRFLEHPGLTAILSLRAVAAVWTCATSLYGAPVSPVPVTLLLATSLIRTWRLRLISEEAEVMNLMVLFPLAFYAWRPADPLIGIGGLWFISLQACVAYFGAGVHKLRSRSWRSGVAVTHFVDGSILRNPAMARTLSKRPRLGQLICWYTIALEILFPLALVVPAQVLPILLFAGFLFHLGIAITLGLGSFLWAFLATYPAIFFVNKSVSLMLWRQ